MRKSSSLKVFHVSQAALLSSTNLKGTEMAPRVKCVLPASLVCWWAGSGTPVTLEPPADVLTNTVSDAHTRVMAEGV